jgi:hypothetical protein
MQGWHLLLQIVQHSLQDPRLLVKVAWASATILKTLLSFLSKHAHRTTNMFYIMISLVYICGAVQIWRREGGAYLLMGCWTYEKSMSRRHCCNWSAWPHCTSSPWQWPMEELPYAGPHYWICSRCTRCSKSTSQRPVHSGSIVPVEMEPDLYF